MEASSGTTGMKDSMRTCGRTTETAAMPSECLIHRFRRTGSTSKPTPSAGRFTSQGTLIAIPLERGTQNKYTPTALERNGDFSKSFQNNGSLIVITDPNTGAPFP